ncbi:MULTISPECIES: calcium:proton antiporter [Dyella]|uniref:Calcium:proton antiporter n=2 Tax=Dyella TaxID=231454 RepID=A0A4R0YTL3_9GAMM|nr:MULTISPECIES: calcium:proton antiporter [Dyella]TBR36471.1 calcium:proton antiporter [Dyella terrae]TCI08437.1 calcium:proton antiporter [Dyella soli]
MSPEAVAPTPPTFTPKLLIRPAIAWATVTLFLIFGSDWMAQLSRHEIGLSLFAWLFCIIVWVAFGVVHEAEELASLLGEPLGTLVLTLSIVIIEVVLISAVMLGAGDTATLARDTMYAVLMIVLNGVVGLGLLIGGMRHHEQAFNLHGASAFLAVIIPLATIALVLPKFVESTSDGTLTAVQAVAFSILTVALYGLFLWLQTGRHKGYFVALRSDTDENIPAEPPPPPRTPKKGEFALHLVLLLVNILPIVILSKSLAKVLDYGIAATGAPVALGGVIIAMLVFTPEGIAAVSAIRRDELTRAINLCLGAAASTVGLTVPAVLLIGLITGKPVVLGLPAASIVLLASTLMLSTLTFSGWRTTMLEGAVHLSMFVVFLVLVFSP